MAENQEKKKRRSFEEKKAADLAEIDKKINATYALIDDIKKKRAAVESRVPAAKKGREKSIKTKITDKINALKAEGKSDEEIAKMFNIE